LATILEEQLPRRLNIPSEVVVHLDLLEDHEEANSEEHCTGKLE
jgi:hypothetical protein